MRKTIYGIGSIFLVIGILFALFIIKATINYDDKDPYHLSPSAFENTYNDKESYSYIYIGNNRNSIFICLDKNTTKEEDKRKPKCKGQRRYINIDELKKERVDELLRSI